MAFAIIPYYILHTPLAAGGRPFELWIFSKFLLSSFSSFRPRRLIQGLNNRPLTCVG
jgi:hypothetical protein